MEQQRSTIEVFCCYAHEHEYLLKELQRHLSSLQRQQLINVWHDRDSSAGTESGQESPLKKTGLEKRERLRQVDCP
jgi:hypothetical protein